MAKRLLSIDDDPGMLSLIRRVACDLGFEVDIVSHASFFMAAYVRRKPDVITLDIIMPDVDGIELIRWLGDVGCQARVIVMSGAALPYAKMAHRLGEDGAKLAMSSLSKPFGVGELRAALTA
jgi:DNA-binding response OmpR family regulator